jgi:uncharacterized damage-inducible protein DinB
MTLKSVKRKLRCMAFAKQAFQLDIEYLRWANQRILEACGELPPDALARDLHGSHGTMLNLLWHIYAGERGWTHWLQESRLPPMSEIGGPDDPRPPLSPEADFAALELAWPTVWDDLAGWIQPLTEGELEATIPCVLWDGRVKDFPRWQILRHIINHSSLHRGQAVTMLRMLGATPPNVDIIGYYLSD